MRVHLIFCLCWQGIGLSWNCMRPQKARYILKCQAFQLVYAFKSIHIKVPKILLVLSMLRGQASLPCPYFFLLSIIKLPEGSFLHQGFIFATYVWKKLKWTHTCPDKSWYLMSQCQLSSSRSGRFRNPPLGILLIGNWCQPDINLI